MINGLLNRFDLPRRVSSRPKSRAVVSTYELTVERYASKSEVPLRPEAQMRIEVKEIDGGGHTIVSQLIPAAGTVYPITDGIPRFAMLSGAREAVESFGDQWNNSDFADFKQNWFAHTIANTFVSIDSFKGHVVVDSSAGSDAQFRWTAEAGAKLVIVLELSHSMDGVMRKVGRARQRRDRSMSLLFVSPARMQHLFRKYPK